MLENILCNLSGQETRTVRVNDREYLVAPITIIVPGVLNGSNGPLYYPAEEIARNYDTWNGRPLMYYHPKKGEQNVSANDPEMWAKWCIGYIFNTQINSNGHLSTEGWFDVAKLVTIDQSLLTKIKTKQKVEVSTGLKTHQVPKSGTFNGVTYTHIAQDYRPDHLAVLPDEVGACSVNDGCGIFNTESIIISNNPNDTGVSMFRDRTKVIDFIVGNCTCYKEDTNGRKKLEGMTDNQLNEVFVANAGKKVEEANDMGSFLEWIGNAPKDIADSFLAMMKKRMVASMGGAAKEGNASPPSAKPASPPSSQEGNEFPPKKEEEKPPTEDPLKKKMEEEKVMMSANNSPKTLQDWLATVPAEVAASLNVVINSQKTALVERLTAHLTGNAKAESTQKLMTKSIEDLQERIEMLPPSPVANVNPMAAFTDFFGAGIGSPVANRQAVKERDPIPDSRVDYSEWAKEDLQTANRKAN